MHRELSGSDSLVRGAATGVMVGVVLGLAARWFPGLAIAWGGAAMVVGLVGAVGLQAAAGAPRAGRRRALLLAAGALALGAVIYVLQGRRFELFGLLLLGACLGAAQATVTRATARPWVIVAAASLTPLVVLGLRALLDARLLGDAVPPIVAGGLQLGLAGAALALPALAARFAPREDALERRAAEARRQGAFDPEVAPLVDRALSLRGALRRSLAGDPAQASARDGQAAAALELRVDGLCAQMLALGERHRTLLAEARAGLSSGEPGEQRAGDLRRRAAEAADPVAAAEYTRAADMVAEQSRHAAALRSAADRIVARLHGFVATLERVQLSVAGAHGGAAERAAWDLTPALEALQTRAVELESEAAGAAEAGSI